MRTTTRILSFALALGAPGLAAGKPTVVASLPDLGALAREVAKDRAEVVVLAASGQDPHYVDPRPSLLVPLSRADLLVVNGLELEAAWLSRLLVNARNPKIQVGAPGYLDASVLVNKLDVPSGPIDRAMGDIHPGGNPHFLFDPRQAARIAVAIGERLAALDPSAAELFRTSAAGLEARLLAIAERERLRFATLPAERRRVVTYHRSLVYLEDWLGLSDVASVEPKPGIRPDPGHVAHVLQLMRGQQVRVILQESFYPKNPSETLAKLAGGELVVIPGSSSFETGEDYPAALERTAETIFAALRRGGS